MKKYKRIIFVGESGTGRSAMAEHILKQYRLDPPMEIECRGMVALFPEPINQKAEAVLISNGISTENHISEQLTEEDFDEDTLMIVMEQEQRQKLLANYASAYEENVQVLTQLTGDELEILNPYGGVLQSYGLCYETLNKSLKKLVNIINEGE